MQSKDDETAHAAGVGLPDSDVDEDSVADVDVGDSIRPGGSDDEQCESGEEVTSPGALAHCVVTGVTGAGEGSM